MRPIAIRSRDGLLSLAALALACGAPDATPPSPPAPVASKVIAVALRAVPVEFAAAGAMGPAARAEVATRLAGRVLEVAVREGDRVEPGQLLARVDARDVAAAVERARAQLEEARAGEELARLEAQRAEALFREEAIAPQEHDRAVAGQARANAARLAAERAVAEAEVAQTYGELRAPFAGVVVARLADAGDLAVPGMPLVAVERQDSLRVIVAVAETDAAGVAAGDSVTVEVGSLSRRGAVGAIVPAAATRTYDVQVWLDNGDGRLPSGQFARVRFSRGTRPALLVPAGAVVRRGQLAGVWTVLDGRAVLRWLRLGDAFGGDIEVLAGLDAGTAIVADASATGLRDGAPVRGS